MSIVGVMITNGGTHPPEKYAAMTAGQIIQIGQNAAGAAAVIGRRMELKILDILEEAHSELQSIEKAAIAQFGSDVLTANIDPSVHVDKPLAAIIETAKNTPYEAHFALETTRDYLRRLLLQHFGTAMHIERKTFADTIPGDPKAQAYIEKTTNGVASA